MTQARRFCFRLGAGLLLLTLVAATGEPPACARTDQPGAALAQQDDRFASAFAEVDRWVARSAFPGAVLAVGQHGRLRALKSFGRLASSSGAPTMPVDAIFDLASLTKVVGTTTAAAILYERGQLDLDAPVARYLPEFGGAPGHDRITVRQLLTHSSGLQLSEPLWHHARDRNDILRAIDTLPAPDEPGSVYRYQDFNMILVGEMVERISGRPLDAFLQQEVFAPLQMRDTGFRPVATLLPRIAPTEQDDVFRHRLVQGTVHDENADLLGGVAGHAGLFSTARDLARFAQLYLDSGRYRGRRLLRASTVRMFATRQNMPPGSSRALGWDTPSPNGFSGPLASPRALIHTGFTGTSIYIDPDRDAYIILLTNRVNPTRENVLISQARPAIHSAILRVLDGMAARP